MNFESVMQGEREYARLEFWSVLVPFKLYKNSATNKMLLNYIFTYFKILLRLSDHERILIVKNDTANLMINYVDQVSTEQPTLTSYYIFVPYVLAIEALLVLIPRYIWAFMINYQTQLDMGEM
jgi:hypothetical protein